MAKYVLVYLYMIAQLKLVTSQSNVKQGGQQKGLIKDPLVRVPCMCAYPTCTCCLNVKLPPTDENQIGCARLAYDGENIGVKLDLDVGNLNLYEGELSVANPPPACVTLPVPVAQFCAQVHDLRLQPDMAQACVRLSFRVLGADVAVADFDCVKLASGAVAFGPP